MALNVYYIIRTWESLEIHSGYRRISFGYSDRLLQVTKRGNCSKVANKEQNFRFELYIDRKYTSGRLSEDMIPGLNFWKLRNTWLSLRCLPLRR